ncbi:MAG: hypothetical protein GQ570_06100 [Helicobacteraceae bacterium]|nr:hypothetical protein [Helicobacteraceae bacterium]
MREIALLEKISWDLFKEYKHSKKAPTGLDNFQFLLHFLEVFYKPNTIDDYYDMIESDETGVLMLNKRDLHSSDNLEKYMIDINEKHLFSSYEADL